MNVPNHEKKAFRDMTPEERSAIVEALLVDRAEAHDACAPGVWVDFHGALQAFLLHRGLQFGDFVLRTKQRQLVIPWEHIKTEYKWAAMDKNGEVNVHSKKPKECEDGWWSISEARLLALNIDTAGIDWRESLTARPEGV